MTANIQTIFFDVGNTLRIVLPDQEFIDRAEAGLMELIGTTESHDALFAKLEERWKAYRKQSKTTLLDASEGELWTQYMLPEYDPNMIFANAPKLTRLWRDHDGRRVARPDAVATIKELHRRGYTLGIIANTVTETEIPDWMAADGVAQCFKTTILSCLLYTSVIRSVCSRRRRRKSAVSGRTSGCSAEKSSTCACISASGVRSSWAAFPVNCRWAVKPSSSPVSYTHLISHDLSAALQYASHILHIGDTVFFGTKAAYLNEFPQAGQKGGGA